MKYVIGNWKANKNFQEVGEWIDGFKNNDLSIFQDAVTVVICPPFPWIPLLHEAFKHEPSIHVGAQDVSAYGSGQHTGEVSAETLVGMIDYTLIGHSERRSEEHETNEVIAQDILQARQNNIEPILLVRSETDSIPQDIQFVAYEPVEAIGTGNAVTPDDVITMKDTLHIGTGMKYLYGGSVNSHNVYDYVSRDDIDGVVPGTASLDPQEFYTLLKNCLPS